MNIELRPVDANNWEACIQLKAKPEQAGFIASNLYSIAQVQFLEGFVAMAIYAEETMVGFTMYGPDEDDGNYWIYRLMIDAKYQGRGYGRQALHQVVDQIRSKPDRTDVIMLSYHPDNKHASALYAQAGFEEIGIMPWSMGRLWPSLIFRAA